MLSSVDLSIYIKWRLVGNDYLIVMQKFSRGLRGDPVGMNSGLSRV